MASSAARTNGAEWNRTWISSMNCGRAAAMDANGERRRRKRERRVADLAVQASISHVRRSSKAFELPYLRAEDAGLGESLHRWTSRVLSWTALWNLDVPPFGLNLAIFLLQKLENNYWNSAGRLRTAWNWPGQRLEPRLFCRTCSSRRPFLDPFCSVSLD